MCDHALPGMCEHALPTWSEVIRDPSDFKEETLLHVLADDVILKIDTIPLPAFRTFKVFPFEIFQEGVNTKERGAAG